MKGRRRDERGAIAVWASVALLAFMVVIGLGVDFAGHTRAQQEARAVAAEAARAGGQQLTLAEGRVTPVAASAPRAAERYAQDAGYSGSATVSGTSIRVTVSGTYPTSFLGVIGIREIAVEASATAEVTPTLGED